MGLYTVPISGPNGSGNGTITVNASDPEAAVQNAYQGGNTPTGPATGGGGSGGSSSSGGGGGGGNSNAAANAQQQLSQALASGNKAAADEAIRQFNATFGLDSQKFAETVNEYNKNYGLAQSGVTGVNPDGTPTLAAQKQQSDAAAQAAGITGFYSAPVAATGDRTAAAAAWQRDNPNQHTEAFASQPASVQAQYGYTPATTAAPTQTEAAHQFDVTSAQAALDAHNKTGMDLLNLASTLHADPFRQLQVMYGASGMDGINRAVQGLSGQYGLPGNFTAPGAPGVDANGFPTGNTATLGGAMQAYNNAGQGQTPGQQAAATGLTNPNQIIARNYNSAPQNVKDFATSALSMNNGLDQKTNDEQIQKNLPQFNAPSFGLATV